MHAYLIITKNREEADKSINKIAKVKNAEIFYRQLTKIEEVRDLIKTASLSLSKPSLYVIENISKASTDALNAFLKLLEEPQEYLSFALIAPSEYDVLPTIISRCEVIKLSGSIHSDRDLKLATEFVSMPVTQKFQLFSEIKNRDDAVLYLEKLISGLHSEMLKNTKNSLQIAKTVKYAQNSLKAIKLNGNIHIQLTNFAVSASD